MLLKVNVSGAFSRSYFSIDVFCDGKNIGSLDNFSDVELKENYTADSYQLGKFNRLFSLGNGLKRVTVYLPWSVAPVIEEIELDDTAFTEAVRYKKKLLAFGDSITQGYDTLRPSNHYIARFAKMLDVDVYNKGIGGEIYFPSLSACKDDFDPDLITVAYGTNDWFSIDAELFKERCRIFYENLSTHYPYAKIFAISPTWRKNYTDEKQFGDFRNVNMHIADIVKDIPNVVCIDGFDFIPHEPKYFGDQSLHPNDEGFTYYANGLYEAMKRYI